jgi:hypothetical protein
MSWLLDTAVIWLTIATGNDRDFKRSGLKVFNPFKELS